jgi:methylmalonyl-CoA mutase
MTTEPTTRATAFAAEFPASEEEWRKAAEAALKGRPLDRALGRSTIDGVPVDAIAPRVEAKPIAGRPAGAPWIAMTRIDLPDAQAANAQALEDLNNGASGLSLVFAPPGGGDGLVADTVERLDAALAGVLLDLAPIHLDVAPFEGRATAALVAALVEKRGFDPASTTVLFGADLIRNLIRTGALPNPWPEMRARFAGTVKALRARGFVSPVAMLDMRVAHSVGASEAQELGTALASATEHVRALLDNGVDLDTAADAMAFAFACDADQFASIAKLRAFRLLWAAWRREAGLREKAVHVHAETSRRMMTRRDPQTNMVRTAIAAFAAGVGGADSVTVLPYTFALDGADADARRLARNTQAMVMEESNAHRVADPAAGAGAIEALTERFAEAGWSAFRAIERSGGLHPAVMGGAWQAGISETRKARAALVATRQTPIVGVSEFPQGSEQPTSIKRPAAPPPAPATQPLGEDLGDGPADFERIVSALLTGASFADIRAAMRLAPSAASVALDLDRSAESFEALWAANGADEARAFLALIGPVARHAARAGFVRNLLAAGGLGAIEGPAGADAETTAATFADSGAGLAIVCGADDGYAADGEAVVAALKARGATVWLAGRPKDGAEALEAAGVSRFVTAGDDALATLQEAGPLARQTAARAAGGAS